MKKFNGIVGIISLILLLILTIQSSYAGDKEELQLKQAFLQEKIAKMEAINKANILEIRLIQLEYPQVQQELQKVNKQLQELQEKEKK